MVLRKPHSKKKIFQIFSLINFRLLLVFVAFDTFDLLGAAAYFLQIVPHIDGNYFRGGVKLSLKFKFFDVGIIDISRENFLKFHCVILNWYFS